MSLTLQNVRIVETHEVLESGVELGDLRAASEVELVELLRERGFLVVGKTDGEWDASFSYAMGRSDCDWRSNQYKPDRISDGRKRLDRLAAVGVTSGDTQ